MGLRLVYYGQNDSLNATPDVLLTGDPGTDQTTLINAGYLSGRIMAIAGNPQNASNVETVIVPCDVDASGSGSATETATAGIIGTGPFNPGDRQYTSNATTTVAAGNIPFAALINGPGEFSGAIGPAGSKKAPVVRGLWQGNVNQESYDTQAGIAFIAGQYVYCGGSATGASKNGGSGNANVGLYTTYALTSAVGAKIPVGICTHVPSTQEPWLGVASLL